MIFLHLFVSIRSLAGYILGQIGLNFTDLAGYVSLAKKAIICQLTTMLATSKIVLFPGPNHLLTTSAHDLTLWLSPEHQVIGHF